VPGRDHAGRRAFAAGAEAEHRQVASQPESGKKGFEAAIADYDFFHCKLQNDCEFLSVNFSNYNLEMTHDHRRAHSLHFARAQTILFARAQALPVTRSQALLGNASPRSSASGVAADGRSAIWPADFRSRRPAGLGGKQLA
jgi:hypothetical protein